ncbi:hypothetical protein [Actinomycetospora aeridis]|uniref:Uncharacterized protein n=1 Tax=Actinomycetospora aeridis TaxID=3129231 RepID=A0ABU8N238_9PSEU
MQAHDVRRGAAGRTWRVGLIVSAVVAVAVVSGLVGGAVALSFAPRVEAGPAVPVAVAAPPVSPVVAPAATTTRSVEPSRRTTATSERSQNSESSRTRSTTAADDTDGDTGESDDDTAGRTARSEDGDGCGPYEHKLPGGYCSPDTDVLDENGNPDPARAVVPGNLD